MAGRRGWLIALAAAGALPLMVPSGASAAPLDPRCTHGRAICVDKSSQTVRFVRNGNVVLSVWARFGGSSTPTRNGVFHVYWKDRNHVSNLYPGLPMPYAMFFSGGQAIHYSPAFNRSSGGHSHGCVETHDRGATRELYDLVREGDRVVVYWS